MDAPSELDRHIVPHAALWALTDPISHVQRADRLTLRTNCPEVLTWRIDDEGPESAPMAPGGGVMAGSRRFHITLGPFPEHARALRFRLPLHTLRIPGGDVCSASNDHEVSLQ